MTPLEEQERFICSQLEDLREQYRKACEPWLEQLGYLRSLRHTLQIVLSERDYKQWKEQQT